MKYSAVMMGILGVLFGVYCESAGAACSESMPEQTLTGKLTYFNDDASTMGTDYSLDTADGESWLVFPTGPYFGLADDAELGYTRGAKFDAVFAPFVNKMVKITACAGKGYGIATMDRIRTIEIA